MSLFDLHGRVILVTGGYGYLGSSICVGLARQGARVYVLARSRDKFAGQDWEGLATICFQDCDVSSTASVREALAEVFAKEKGIDALVNNAFYVKGGEPLGLSDVDWAHGLEGTLGSVYRCIREIVPYLKRGGGGRIVNVSSMYGMVSPDFAVYQDAPHYLNPPHYGAAKAGVIQLTKYFAQYLGKDNILVNAISLGPFPSEGVQENEKFIAALENKVALGRIGKPADVQGAFVFLCSEAANYITGHNLVVDGGWTIS